MAVLRVYMRHAVRHPVLLILMILGTIGIQTADLTVPVYLKRFFNVLALQNSTSAAYESLISIILSIGMISFFGWISRRIHIFSLMYIESKVMAELMESAFDYLLRHSHRFFISQFTGTLTRRVSKFSHAFETILDSIIMNFFPTTIFVAGAISIVYLRNHTLGLILAAWAIFIVAFQIYVSRLRQPLRVASAEEDSRVAGALSDAITNQNTIALFSGNKFEGKRFSDAVNIWRKVAMRAWTADKYIWSALGILMVGLNIGILYGAIKFWQRGLLTIGDFVMIQIYLMGTFEKVIGINRELRRVYSAFADATEMIEILNAPYDVKDIPAAKTLMIGKCEIEFRNVQFYFNQTRPILKNFNLLIASGEKIALVGPSGAGKSTVSKLLLRLYDVSSGKIEINGQNVSKITQDSLHEAIAFVPQEPILFHRTLMENIRYGQRDASDEDVLEAAKKAHAHEFISKLPEGYRTFVGERGVKLSGGERQRVAIARAILKNAPILLLDEATSSLDSESEALIQDALQTLMLGKTVIVIAHRLSTIMKMDRIIVIENGKIAAEGTHSELIAEGGLYQKLWSIQAGGFLTEEPEIEPEKENGEEDIKLEEEKEEIIAGDTK